MKQTFLEYWNEVIYGEDFSPSQATAYLKKLDSELYASIKDTSLSQAKKKFSMKFHPDKGNDSETMKMINQAFDVLSKSGVREMPGTEKKDYSGFWDKDPLHEGKPIWAWAGAGRRAPTVSINAYDRLKREAWVLAGKPEKEPELKEYTFQLFDGMYSRSIITVYSNDSSIKKVIKPFLDWCDKFYLQTKKMMAIVVTNDDRTKTVVFPFYGDKFYNSFNIDFEESMGSIFNNKRNVEKLKQKLAELDF